MMGEDDLAEYVFAVVGNASDCDAIMKIVAAGHARLVAENEQLRADVQMKDMQIKGVALATETLNATNARLSVERDELRAQLDAVRKWARWFWDEEDDGPSATELPEGLRNLQ